MKATKADMRGINPKLLSHTAVSFEEAASSIILGHPVSLGIAPSSGEMGGSNGYTREMQDGSLLVVLDRSLLIPSISTCKQAIWHVIMHELAHAADWDRLHTGGRTSHDVHFGIEYAKTYRACTKG